MCRTNLRIVALLIVVSIAIAAASQPIAPRISGTVLDPAGRPVAAARVQLVSPAPILLSATTDRTGSFTVTLPTWGRMRVRVEADGFEPIVRDVNLSPTEINLTLRLERIATASQQVIIAADVSEVTLDSPDPSERVMVREELLDANPGRPGAPVSIPGLPIETASGGIKAPQYFVPGVAGDHGEPIAQYIAVGGYRVSNNLSANAHGNGYADPNIYIAAVLGNVETDGGAFNVLEGNHALNLAATYSLRPQARPFVTLTGDYRDLDLTVGIAPADSTKKEWLALEANYGNGLTRLLEHRQQYKWNAMRILNPGNHRITLVSIGYWGESHEGNLVPLGLGLQVNDTIDPRQKDQTHTSIFAADDQWQAGTKDVLGFAGFFRTYNLALYSNFGEGLIRQSEFRTVEGVELRETHTFGSLLKASGLEALAGLDFNEDDIHRDNLDHYLSGDPGTYGPFLKVLANNLTLRDVAPYVAFHGDAGKHVRFYAGLRPEVIEIKNADVLKPAESFDLWNSFVSPKATVAWSPGSARWLPSASFSIGQSFYTEDPRIGVAPEANASLASPLERSHSEQLVLEKALSGTDIRLTLGRTTTTATLAKIDPDTGLPEDLGPGSLKFLTASVRRQFSFGSVQAVFSKADARLMETPTTPAMVTPEAPRTIFDALATLDRMPWGLEARGEYEYVGHKLLDLGGFEAIPVGETRMAVVKPLLHGSFEIGANGMVARGYTGQTTELFAPGWHPGGPPPACAPSVDGIANDFDCGTVEQSVGVRMASWIGGSVSWRFGARQ